MTDSPRKAGTEKKIPMNNAHRLDHILDSAQVPYIDETWEPWRLPHLTRLFGEVADAILLVNARNDLAWLLDALARSDQRCEDHQEPPNADDPTDAEVRAAAEAIARCTFPDKGWWELSPWKREYNTVRARAALVAARKVSGR